MVDNARRGRGSKQTREKLTRAAAELIAEVGWGRVTTRAVAERAGLPHGAVSYHFRGKQELLIEACLEAFGRAVPFEDFAALGGFGDLIDMIAAQLSEGLVSDSAMNRLMFEAIREAERDDLLRERLAAMIADYRAAVVDIVRADQERGVISRQLTAEGVATLVTSLGDGLFLHALLDPELEVIAALTTLRASLAVQ